MTVVRAELRLADQDWPADPILLLPTRPVRSHAALSRLDLGTLDAPEFRQAVSS